SNRGGYRAHVAVPLPSTQKKKKKTVSKSFRMCRRLRQKGIRAVRTLDPTLAEVSPDHRQFDAVFCLNVLDRCKSPRKLLGRIAELVLPGGTVVISLPLPLAQLDALRNDHKEQEQERLKLRLTDTERAVIVKRLERTKSLEWRRSSEGTTITIEEHLDDPSKVYQRRRGELLDDRGGRKRKY
ncbi:hypothetical protein FOZ63_006354, partial [Perkinsus olseni]